MAWILINNVSGVVDGIWSSPPLPGQVRGDQFTVKEWFGPVSMGDPDPTIGAETELADISASHQHFDNLAELATVEIAWLQGAIPDIDSMDLAELRAVLKRLAQENLHQIRAWRYILKRMGAEDCGGC